MISSRYKDQVALLLEVVEPALDDSRLALKGGTAINLFYMDMPRLSVDLDLTYLPINDRTHFVTDIEDVFKKLGSRLKNYSVELFRTSEGIPKQARVSKGRVEVKVEVNLVLRGSVYPPQERVLCAQAQQEFEKSAKVLCLSFEELYAGKFCAALDRQHPRDLFDVMMFFENYSFTEKLKKAFLVYLISGNRPINEVLKQNKIDQRLLFEKELVGMTLAPIDYTSLEKAREKLIETIHENLTQEDRQFLLSLKEGNPQWDLLAIPGVENLPGVKWKLINIQKMLLKRREGEYQKLKEKLEV